MPSLYTEIEMNATRAQAWDAIVRKEYWQQWNSFLFDRSPDRSFQLGRTVLLSLQRLKGETDTEFEAIVTVMQPHTCLQWKATAPGYINEHTFELQDVGWQRIKFTHRETFSGRLSGIFLPFIRQDEQQGLDRMARELKYYIER
jgi:hypothetical protein